MILNENYLFFCGRSVEGSRSKNFFEQQELISSYSRKANVPYRVPTILDTGVSIFMEYIRTGINLYPADPWTFTRCEEKYNADSQLVVGGFAQGGLYVDGYYVDDVGIGVAGFRKF